MFAADHDEVLRFSTPKSEKCHDAFVVRAVAPDQAIFWLHAIGDILEPALRPR